MNANCIGALKQLDWSWRALLHNGKRMTKPQVKAVLEYAVKCGYEHTGLLSDEEVDKIINEIK